MIRCIEFKGKEAIFDEMKGHGVFDDQIIKHLVSREQSALDQLNEYLQQNEQEIDYIRSTRHEGGSVWTLEYRVITEAERMLIGARG